MSLTNEDGQTETVEPGEASDRPGWRRSLLAATCCGVLFLYAVYLGALSVLLPFLGASFGLGSADEGRLFPANFLGFSAGVVVCGYLSDRFGRKSVLLAAIGAYAGGLFLFAFSTLFSAAMAAAVLIGVGSGAMEIVASALAADLYPERRAYILNGVQIAFGAGAAFSPALAHALLNGGTDWRQLYAGLAVADSALLIALAAQTVPRLKHAPEALDIRALRVILRQPAFLILCLAEALYVGAETGFFSWMPTYFQRTLPGGPVWAGWVVTVFWVAMTVGRIVTGGLIERVALRRLVLGLACGGILGAGLSLAWTNPVAVLACVAGTGLCFSGIFGLILADAGERYPRVAGTVFGGVVAAGGIGGAVIPWTVGALADTPLGWRGALGLIPLVVCGIALLMGRLRPRLTAPPPGMRH